VTGVVQDPAAPTPAATEESPAPAPTPADARRRRLRLSWLALLVVLVVGLVVGTSGDRGPRTTEERVDAIAETVRCPTCRSQAAADSDAASGRAVVAEIGAQVEAGRTDDEIRAYFSDIYGEQILLTPSGSGFVGLVWVLPVVALVLGAAGLALTFRRWKRWST